MDLRGKFYVGLKLQTFAYFHKFRCFALFGSFSLSVFLDAFLFHLRSPITRISPQFDGIRLRLETLPRIQWAIFVASRSRGSNLVFHWSAA